MKYLLTGGAGYIGSHTAVELLEAGHEVVVIDNLSNSTPVSLDRVKEITGKSITFIEADVRDREALDRIFTEHTIDGVIHFAGFKAVGESVEKPREYYANNLDSTLVLLDAMKAHGITKLVFSSSATVYGDPESLPLTEQSTTGVGITNPYGWTKFMIEQILRDTTVADPSWQITTLRYFNPVGAHPSGLIGEDPSGPPNNLMPYVSQVAVGKREKLSIHGDSYDTPDGTGVRDYIHIVDLARGHVAALGHMSAGYHVYNLGSGKGTSVLEIVAAFKEASGRNIPYEIGPARAGDIAACYADCSLAKKELDWETTHTILDACRDAWNWQSKNPDGYTTQKS